jgi:exodeoxyribonuclease VII large subunit
VVPHPATGIEELATRSIAELYDEIEGALEAAFPRGEDFWVSGEIQKITEAASGHAYLDIVDPDAKGERNAPVLRAKCWKGTWSPLRARLRREGIELAAGMMIIVKGSIGLYKARAEIDFTISDVNSDALLGRLARERQALIDSLRAEGLFDAQRSLSLGLVPLNIGVVGSPGTEGFNDFMGQLERSGFAFSVAVVPTAVQGAAAPREIAGALRLLSEAGAELVCLVRGGGSKADLAAFDSAELVRAITSCPVPVWTGIGHTGDESVADLVSHEPHITPTACGVAIVSRVAAYWSAVVDTARAVAAGATSVVRAEAAAHTSMRAAVVAAADRSLRESERSLHYARSRLLVSPISNLARARESVSQRGSRLLPASKSLLATTTATLDGRRRLLDAYDPRRTLERGWSMTLDAEGRALRSVDQVSPGATITTRVADGQITSTVTDLTAKEEEG